jgi:hypothetical protein
LISGSRNLHERAREVERLLELPLDLNEAGHCDGTISDQPAGTWIRRRHSLPYGRTELKMMAATSEVGSVYHHRLAIPPCNADSQLCAKRWSGGWGYRCWWARGDISDTYPFSGPCSSLSRDILEVHCTVSRASDPELETLTEER